MRTDHNPNLSMMKGKTKSYDTLSDEIMQFMPFKMEFLNGNKMFVDALSRMPKTTCAVSQNPLKLFSSTSTPLLDLDILLAQQKRDPALLKAIMFHQGQISLSNAPPFAQHTHLFQDLVCKFIPSPTGRKRVILVPKPLRPILLYLVHDECGHSSATYTLKRLQENCFWDGMSIDTKIFCKSCNTCAKSKPPHKYNRLPLEPMEPTAREFGDRLHIDLLSMPRSADGHVAICTAVDAATGFVFATCLLYTSPSPRDLSTSRMPSSA